MTCLGLSSIVLMGLMSIINCRLTILRGYLAIPGLSKESNTLISEVNKLSKMPENYDLIKRFVIRMTHALDEEKHGHCLQSVRSRWQRKYRIAFSAFKMATKVLHCIQCVQDGNESIAFRMSSHSRV